MTLDQRLERVLHNVADTAAIPAVDIAAVRGGARAKRIRTVASIAAVGLTVAVVAAGVVASNLYSIGPNTPMSPASTASPPTPDATLQPGQSVGSHMTPPMEAKAPDSWAVITDGAYVRLTSGSLVMEINGPITDAVSPPVHMGGVWEYPPIGGPDGYVEWLREYPRLKMLEDRTVTVDGKSVPQLTFQVKFGTWLFGVTDALEGTRFETARVTEGQVATVTVIEVGSKTMLVTSSGAETDADRARLQSATDLVLSTVELPKSSTPDAG